MPDKWTYSPDMGTIQIRDGVYYSEEGHTGPEDELQWVRLTPEPYKDAGPDLISTWKEREQTLEEEEWDEDEDEDE